MASIGNYASALAEAARNTVKSSATGIGAAIKGAARSEMPGINSAYSFAESLRSGANSRSNKNDKDKKSTSSSSSAASTNPSSGGTNFNAAVVRELQLINANIIEQTRLLRYQVDSAKTKSQYDEENAREQALRDSKLLDAINNLGSRGGGRGGAGGAGGGNEEGPGIGSALASGAAEGIASRIFGGKGSGSKGSFGKKLLKGGGVLGLGAGALYTYGRMKNGENLSDIAKDLAPGLTGAALGGFVGSIAGPLGTILGSMIGGALGDSSIGRKMFEDILPKIKELGAAVGIDFDQIKTSFETVLLPKIKSSVENLTKVFNDVIIPNLRIVSEQLLNSFESIQGTFNNKIIPGLNKLSDSSGKVLDRILSIGAREAGKVYSTGESNPLPNKIETTKRETVVSRIVKYPGESEQSYKNRLDLARWVDNQQLINSVESRKRIDIVEDVAKSNEKKAVAAGGRVKSNYFAPATPVTPAGGTSFEQTSDASGLGFSYDPKELLDLIAKAESGRMGYTAANKGKPGDMPQGYPQLKDLTISQVMDMQQSRPGKQREFFAVGRYQIIPETLKGLMRGDYGPTGLNVDDKFSEENQDKLALVLIKNREKRAKNAGGGLDTFQKEISQEWAGIGLPNTNLSSYENINGNKASVNTDAFRKIFKQNTTPTESKIKYPSDSTDRAKEKIGSVVGSGTTIVDNTAAKLVVTVDSVREAVNEGTKVAKKIGKETVDNFKNLAQSSARIANTVAPRNRPIRPILKTPEQIIAETNANFAKAFQKAVPKAFNLALRQALFPKGVGVSQQAAGGALFRGQQLNNIFGINKSVNKLATSLFGKQYGAMFAPALNNLATGYLEAGARAGGRLLFGMIGGMGAEQSNILTGQILGNYARGNKKLAAEQLIYGTTGVATGYETVFAKYGFKNPMEGVNYMANTLGAAVSDPVGRFMDPNAKASEWIDPRTGKKVSLNSTSSFTTDAYGRYNVPQSQNGNNAAVGPTWTSGYDREPTVTPIVGGDRALTITDPTAEAARKQTNDLLTQQNDQIAVDAVRRATDAAEAKYVSQQGDQGIIGKLQEVITAISEGRVGSGSTAGGSLGFGGGGGGGFFGSGGPLANVGNMALDLGRVAATQQISKALGVSGKNPYTAALANFAISESLKYGAKLAYNAVFGNATFAQAAGQTAGYISNAFGLGGTQAAAPIVDLAGTGYAGAATEGAAAAGSIGTTLGATEGAWVAAETGEMLVLASEAGGTAAGLGSAAAGAAEVGLWEVAAAIVVIAGIGELLGFWDDEEPYQPNVIMERVMITRGNNNINAIAPLWTNDLGYLKEEGVRAWMAICDQLLRIGFNAFKAMEVSAKKATNLGALNSDDLPFHYMVSCVQSWQSNSDVVIGFFKGEPKARQNAFASGFGSSGEVDFINFGKIDAFTKLNANDVARRIVKKVEELWKKSYTSKNISADLTKTAEALQKANYNALASGLLEATASRIDTSLSETVWGDMQPKYGQGEFGEQVRYVYDQRTGQWAQQADFRYETVGTGKYEQKYIEDYGWQNVEIMEKRRTGLGLVMGYDKLGKPLYDLNDDGKLSEADFTTDRERIKTVNPSQNAETIGNYIGPAARRVWDQAGNTLVQEEDTRIMGFNKLGKPIYDLNNDRKLTAQDFTSNLDNIKAIIPSATARNVGNYIADYSVSAAEAAARAALGPNAAGGANAAGGTNAVVNSGNKITNNSSSTTIIKRNDSLDVLRSASAQTAVPIG
jgi:hypothetical protein